MRGKRILVFGLAGGFIAFLLCGGTGTCIVARSWQSLPTSTITVGRDTTFLDGPVDEYGYVDYVAALNAQMSEGVTPENNAAVLLLQAFGPPEGDGEYRREIYRLLGVDALPPEGEYFVASEAYFRAQVTGRPTISGERSALDSDEGQPLNAQERFWRDHEVASGRPWSAEEFPDVARWIKANEAPMERIIEASRRPQCYLPIVPLTPEEGLISAGSWLTQSLRDATRLLTVRAMLRVGQGRLDEAWEDLLAGHRLARHVSHSPMMIDGLVGLAMESMATRSQTLLIHYGDLTPEQVARMLDDLAKLPVERSMGDRLVNGERFTSLDAITNMSRNMTFQLEDGGVSRDSEIGQRLLTIASRSAIDWDEILRIVNRYYDDLAAAPEETSLRGRLEAIGTLEAALEAEREQTRGLGRVVRSFISFRSPKKTMSQHLGKIMVALLQPAADAALTADTRGIANRRMLLIALGAAAYRTEYGVYPERLDAVGDYLSEIPVDPYSEQSFRYRLEGDGFMVYSVGPNGRDEEGRNDAEAGGCFYPEADDISMHVPPILPPRKTD